MLLEQGGYIVVSAATLEQVEAACRGGAFDLVLMGWSVAAAEKQASAELIRRYSPDAIILDWCRGKSHMPGAEVLVSNDPNQLLQRIAGLLNHGAAKHGKRVSGGRSLSCG